MEQDLRRMRAALEEARAAAGRQEAPIGAIVVDGLTGEILAGAGNRTRERCDPTAHAELLAIRAACAARGAQRIPECDLYVTLEPCAMCAGAISFARIRRLVFAASDPKGGAVLHGPRFFDQPTCHHRPEIVSGIAAQESGAMLQDFFRALRNRI